MTKNHLLCLFTFHKSTQFARQVCGYSRQDGQDQSLKNKQIETHCKENHATEVTNIRKNKVMKIM